MTELHGLQIPDDRMVFLLEIKMYKREGGKLFGFCFCVEVAEVM